MVAALGALASLAAGGGHLVDVSMQATSAAIAGNTGSGHGPHPIRATDTGWLVHCSAVGRSQLVLQPMPPEVRGTAPALGAHTDRVLAELGQ
jgi:crotonobetainyl-CoA:carnitine CoA-transferase CaiB-like acyl-CoA transferase